MNREKTKNGIKLVVIFVLLFLAFMAINLTNPYHAGDTAKAALEASIPSVTVESNEDYIAFIPDDPTAGLIFYPGAKVDYDAYAPLMSALAERGIAGISVHLPLNYSLLKKDAAEGIAELYPEVKDWYIGGHSLGGVTAATYAAEHASEYKGLVFFASYTMENINKTELDVLSLYGDQDGVLNKKLYFECIGNLPETTTEYVIEGGNHAQFGDYGVQDGDNEATISAEKQVELTADAIANWIIQ